MRCCVDVDLRHDRLSGARRDSDYAASGSRRSSRGRVGVIGIARDRGRDSTMLLLNYPRKECECLDENLGLEVLELRWVLTGPAAHKLAIDQKVCLICRENPS